MTRRRLATLGGGAIALLAAAAGAHVVLVRSGLACPVMRPPSAEALEAQRQRALPSLRGEGAAPSSDAFGFALGTTTRDAFVKDRAARGDACESESDGALVRCAASDASRAELVARFDPSGVLVGADRMRYLPDVEQAGALYRELDAAGHARFGTPVRTWGDSSASYLGSPLHQVGSAYRFVDVAVDLSATHLGPGRIAVREQVRSIPRDPQRARGT